MIIITPLIRSLVELKRDEQFWKVKRESMKISIINNNAFWRNQAHDDQVRTLVIAVSDYNVSSLVFLCL